VTVAVAADLEVEVTAVAVAGVALEAAVSKVPGFIVGDTS
jgi:hypothetical protein